MLKNCWGKDGGFSLMNTLSLSVLCTVYGPHLRGDNWLRVDLPMSCDVGRFIDDIVLFGEVLVCLYDNGLVW